MLRRFVRAYQTRPAADASASCGRSRSRCASCWSRTCGASAERIVRSRVGARRKPTRSPTGCWASNGHAAEPVAALRRDARGAALPTAFAVQLVQRLRDQDPEVTPALGWLEERLARAGHDRRRDRARRAPAPGRDERHGPQHHHQHAPDLRRRLDGVVRDASAWSTTMLRAGGDFADDGFRRPATSTAAPSRSWRAAPTLTELEIARRAVWPPRDRRRRDGRRRSRAARSRLSPDRRRTPRASSRRSAFAPPPARLAGALRRAVGIARLRRRRRRRRRRRPARCRCSCSRGSASAAAWLALLGCSALIPAIDAAVALVNRGDHRGFGATLLPALALRDGVPPDLRTWSRCRRC